MKLRDKKWIIPIFYVAVAIAVIFFSLMWANQTADQSLYVIYITKSSDSNNDFWRAVMQGANVSAKENGVTLELMQPKDETSIGEQNLMIEQAIKKSPNAIVVSPASSTETDPALQKVIDAGIPLVFIDSTTEAPMADAVVATDNISAGKKLGEALLATLKPADTLAIISHVQGSSTAQQRESGFREAMGNRCDQIIETIFCNSNLEQASNEAIRLLETHPEIDYIVCLNEDSAVGAAQGVRKIGRMNSVTLLGFDNATEEIEYLEEGMFSAIVVQKAFTMGYIGIENAAKLARGQSVNYETDSGAELITRENMYEESNQELLFPFYKDEEEEEEAEKAEAE